MTRLGLYEGGALRSLARGGDYLAKISLALLSDETSAVATTAPVTLYVNSVTGNDSNNGLSAETAFADIQFAIETIPPLVRHVVIIYVAPGHYKGFYISGKTISPAPGPSSLAGIYVLATYANASLATGSATGTLTSASPGSSTTVTPTVLGDSANNLTVNNCKGRLLRMLTGAHAGRVIPIKSNTDKTITLAANEAVGSPGDTYVIQDRACIINIPTAMGGFFQFPGFGSFAADPGIGIGIGMNHAGYFQGIVIEGFMVDLPADSFAYSAYVINNIGETNFVNCWFSCSGLTGLLYHNSDVDTRSCVIDGNNPDSTSNNFPVIAEGTAGHHQYKNLFIMSSTGPNLNPAFQVQPTSVSILLNDCYIENCVIGMKIITQCGSTVFLTGVGFTMTGSEGILCTPESGHANSGWTALFGNGVSFEGCSSAILLGGPNAFAQLIAAKGSTNSVGMQIERGARVQIDATSTLTGGTQVTLDGSPTDLPTMRAATPRLLSNAYLTLLFE